MSLTQKTRISQQDKRLIAHISWILVVKFMILIFIWHTWIKPYKIRIDAQSMTHHLAIDNQAKEQHS